jgi:hypothetical protein
MNTRRWIHCNHLFLVLGIIFLLATIGPAQQKQPQAPTNPRAPQLATSGPLGLQRGTAQELALTGSNLDNPVRLWTNIPQAKVTIPGDNNNGKESGKLRVRLEVPPETPVGLYAIRLATQQGLSNLRLFAVDDLPQVIGADNNHSKTTAQPLPVPCVVAGRTDTELSDYYRIQAQAGQRLSFEVLGHRLGSTVDPQITLFDGHTLSELPGGHNNDAPGLQTDARLTYSFKEAGDYLIEVRDVMFRGGPDLWYRLRVGDFPCATSPVPMAAKRGTRASIRFTGPQVESVAAVDVIVPPEEARAALSVVPRGPNGLHGWPVTLAVSDLDESVEREPNNEPAKANRLPVPGAVTGIFQAKGDVDHFALPLKKGQRYTIEAQTHELNSPAEVYLVLKNAAGADVAKSNPAVAPRIDFAVPADGDYVLRVEHLFYWGGPTETYRVSVTPAAPDFGLTLTIDHLDVPQGGHALMYVTPTRRGYGGPIEVSLAGTPDVSGRATIPAAQPVPLLLTAKPDAPLGPFAVSVQGLAVIDGKVVVRKASVRTALSQGLGGLAHPPLELQDQLGLAVTAKHPFALAARLERAESYRGGAAPLTVTAERAPGFDGEIALAALNLPPNITVALKNVPKGKNEVKLAVNSTAKTALGSHAVFLLASATVQGKGVVVILPPATLSLVQPFELKVNAKPLKIEQGGKAKLKITAVRKGGYAGPIACELRNLPLNVSAAKATIAAGKNDAEIEVSAAANAVTADKAGVTVVGAALNQQAASPGFTVSVVKK